MVSQTVNGVETTAPISQSWVYLDAWYLCMGGFQAPSVDFFLDIYDLARALFESAEPSLDALP